MKIFVTIFCSILTFFVFGQKIENIRPSRDGKKIIILYDISGVANSQKFKIKLFCSKDGGINFGSELRNVSGDVNEDVLAGKNKKIIWEVLKDEPFFYGRQIVFKIVAEKIISKEVLTIAISDFKTMGGTSEMQWLGSSCSEAIISKILKSHSIRIVEREYLNRLLDELKLKSTGMMDDKSAVEAGQLIGAKYFIFGSATNMNEKIVLRTRTVNTSTSEILGIQEVTGSINDLFSLQSDLANKISSELTQGNSTSVDKNATDLKDIPFTAFSKIEKLKAMAEKFPLFVLDPGRKKKAVEFMLALNLCDELLKDYPNLYLAHYYKGLFSLHNEDNAIADNESKTAKTLNSDDPNVLILRASYFVINEKYEEAKGLLNFFNSKFIYDSRGWYGMGKVLMNEGKTYPAIEALINSLKNRPYIYQAEGHLRTLVSGNSELIASQFTDNSYYSASMVYKTFWATKKVINSNIFEFAKNASQKIPTLYMPFYMMGLYNYKQGNFTEAYGNYNSCLNMMPEFPEVHRELALLLAKNNECTKGQKQLQLYLKTSNAIEDYEKTENELKKCK
jgi:TolB-like protein